MGHIRTFFKGVCPENQDRFADSPDSYREKKID